MSGGAVILFTALLGGLLTHNIIDDPHTPEQFETDSPLYIEGYDYPPAAYQEPVYEYRYYPGFYEQKTPFEPPYRTSEADRRFPFPDAAKEIRERFKARTRQRYYDSGYKPGEHCYGAGCYQNRPVKRVHGYVWEIRYDPWKGEPITDERTHQFISNIIYDDQSKLIALVGDYDPRSGLPLEYEYRR